MTKLLISLGALAVLSGCASFTSPPYDCELSDAPHAKCASMEQAYAAVKRADPSVRAQSVFERQVAKAESDRPFFQGREAEMPQVGQQGTPVYSQPKVHRVWVAPYVDADGNLRTGEYTYFNTAGKWNYGTTRTPGAASGVFGPAKPDNLGFTPAVAADKAQAGASAKPAAPPAPASPASPAVTPAKPADNGITQPYQKLGD
jgi:type IV conjugative transfer system lipoprotein TraV